MANNKKEEGVDWVKVAEGTVAAAEAAIELINPTFTFYSRFSC